MLHVTHPVLPKLRGCCQTDAYQQSITLVLFLIFPWNVSTSVMIFLLVIDLNLLFSTRKWIKRFYETTSRGGGKEGRVDWMPSLTGRNVDGRRCNFQSGLKKSTFGFFLAAVRSDKLLSVSARRTVMFMDEFYSNKKQGSVSNVSLNWLLLFNMLYQQYIGLVMYICVDFQYKSHIIFLPPWSWSFDLEHRSHYYYHPELTTNVLSSFFCNQLCAADINLFNPDV